MALLLGGSAAFATDFDFEGMFAQDNDVALLDFTVGADSFVTVFTSSWIQGEPTAEVPRGMLGFDPIVGIWDASGDLRALQDNGRLAGSTLSNGIAYDYGVWDVYFSLPLGAGSYRATVTQSDNNPNAGATNLSDGFRRDGEPHFTTAWGNQPDFNGTWGTMNNGIFDDPRTKDWALHIINVNEAQTVPEPSTWLLLGLGGLVVARLQRRR
jgi:hypothetical protein